ncbi:MAG: YndJ family transporter [Pirellulales bacterium]
MSAPFSAKYANRLASGYAPVLTGGVVWLATLALLRPSPLETTWAHLLLMLAALVYLPLGLRLVPLRASGRAGRLLRAAALLQLPAALLLGCAYLLPQGLAAAALTLPWLAVTGLAALAGISWLARRGPLPPGELCFDAGLVYLAVGGAWAVLDRGGFRPLGFEAVIVMLTSVHFHYAGFVLPLLTGLAIREQHGRVARAAGLGVIAGVPLVAVGITATQIGLGPLLECLAAWLTAVAGILAAWLYLRLVLEGRWPALSRGLWVLSAVLLAASMTLAALYGSRFYLPLTWLDIPLMRALHGTANALGFAGAGLAAWTIAARLNLVQGVAAAFDGRGDSTVEAPAVE